MVSSLMLIVVERRETFHYYYPMGVHPPGDLTVTMRLYAVKKTPALGSPKGRSFFYCFSVGVSSLFMQRAYSSRSLRFRTKAAAKAVTGRAMTQTSTPVSPVAGVLAPGVTVLPPV